MSLASMTGFARGEGHHDELRWAWELKSVNSRGLDIRVRVPPGFEAVEPMVRQRLQKSVARGNVSVGLQLSKPKRAGAYAIDQEFLAELARIARQLQEHDGFARASADGLLALRGVIEAVDSVESEAERAQRDEALETSFDQALTALVDARRAEGARIVAVLGERIGQIEGLVGQAKNAAEAQPVAIQERLRQSVAAALEAAPQIAEDRLAQEVALLIVKADVSEELDRLEMHVAAARELLDGERAAGRRLDFLAQEFNREANTLCSKAATPDLSALGLELKVVIDQLREQIQNIE